MNYKNSRKPASAAGQPIFPAVADSLTPESLQHLLAEQARTAALAFGVALVQQDVERLCGPLFARKATQGWAWRGGSEESNIVVDGGRVTFRRPRVRDRDGEVGLPVLAKLQDRDLLDGQIRERMLRGVSTRNYEPVVAEYSRKTGISKASCSRAFIRASQKTLDELNHSDLSRHRFIALMVDGVEYAGRVVIVALGVTDTLQKVPLGVREGDTENADVVRDLLAGIQERGFQLHCERLLAVIDGSKALRRGLVDVFGARVIIQRCWLHKLRNLKAYVPRQHHAQLHWRMKKLMGLVRHDEALRELESFAHWLSQVSHDGAASLREAGHELITVHALGVPRNLRKALSTTNLIESLIGVVRERTARVKNWKSRKTGQILRWVAASLKQHQSRMRRLRGNREVAALIEALGGPRQIAIQAEVA